MTYESIVELLDYSGGHDQVVRIGLDDVEIVVRSTEIRAVGVA